MKPPAFQFYVDDYIGGTQHFTDAEKGVYMALLCEQWSNGSLPDDDEELSSYSRNGTPITRIKRKFKKGEDGRLRNERMEIEREKQRVYRESRSNNGKHGGRPRKPHGKHMVSIPKSTAKAQESSPASVSDLLKKEDPSPPAPPASNHEAFIDGWVKNFKTKFGFEYSFDGGRDGKAVRELLRMNILVIDLLEIAKRAWARAGKPPKAFNCEQASTIHGFRNYFNQIQVELKNGSTTNQPANQRNAGIAKPSTGGDYGEAAKAKLERQALEAKRREASQAQGNGDGSGFVLHGDVGAPTVRPDAPAGGQ